MEPRCDQFFNLSREALQDPHLQEALRSVDRQLRALRDAAFKALGNGEELREAARAIRDHTLDHLDQYLVQLEENVAKLGGTVHWAEDAKAARLIVEQLALTRGVRRIVKGKSMVSEEIDLNRGLEAHGLDVVETDLGEFIIQLAHEPPSHLVGPAIHKTKGQIAQLFCDALDAPFMDEPEKMTFFARKTLREKFLKADMGITGANFIVAQTGAVILLENEGNIRLSTAIPRIHVALTGIEKVVPTWKDLAVLLKLLPRSTTGQKLCSYVSMFLGSKRPLEPDGAEEFHLILLDNGRSRILADRQFRQSLRCIRCGACLNTCPVYLKAGGHAYGWVYSGPIGSILTPQLLKERHVASSLPFASTLCGACSSICPVKIDIPGILTELRQRFAQDPDWGPAPWMEKGLFRLAGTIMGHQHLYSVAGKAARCLQPVMDAVNPPVLQQRGPMPKLSKKPFRKLYAAESGKKERDS
jgi:L-lactate dehydrogenase complex protein LldF